MAKVIRMAADQFQTIAVVSNLLINKMQTNTSNGKWVRWQCLTEDVSISHRRNHSKSFRQQITICLHSINYLREKTTHTHASVAHQRQSTSPYICAHHAQRGKVRFSPPMHCGCVLECFIDVSLALFVSLFYRTTMHQRRAHTLRMLLELFSICIIANCSATKKPGNFVRLVGVSCHTS